MNRIAEIARAVLAALGRLVSRTMMVTKKVGGKLVSVAETSVERVFDAAVAAPRVALDIGGAGCKLVVGAIGDVVRAPFKLAGAMLGGGRGRPQTEQCAWRAVMGRLLDSRGERIDSRLSSLRRNLSRPIGIALAFIVVTVGIAQHPRQWLLLAAMASPLALFTLSDGPALCRRPAEQGSRRNSRRA